MAVIVVDEAKFPIIELATPLNGLLGVAGCRYHAVGGVGIGGADVAVLAVELADILGEIPAASVPGAVFLDSQWMGGYGLVGVPDNIPESGVMAAGKLDACNLQITTVDVALVQRDAAVYYHLLICAAAHSIVSTFDNSSTDSFYASESYRPIFCIVFNLPYACSCFQQDLITIGIELGNKITNRCVLVQFICCIGFTLCDDSVTDVIVAVRVLVNAQGCSGQFASRVVFKAISLFPFLTLLIADCRAPHGIILITTGCGSLIAVDVKHLGNQITLGFVGLLPF